MTTLQSTASPLALFNGSYLGSRPTGIGVVARELVQALDPSLIPLLDPLASRRAGSIPIPSNLSADYGQRGHIRRLKWTQFALPELIRKYGDPILLSPLPEAPIFSRVRSVVIAHDLIPLRYPCASPLLLYHLSYVPAVLHQATRILCNSEATAKEISQRWRVSPAKLIPIRLGFNSGDFKALGLKREPFFLVLGRHDPHKNLKRVLHAFSRIKERSMKIHFVGPHDPRYTPGLQAIACDLDIADRCEWTSWATNEQRLELINRCQALVIASLWEGFGLPALEAMACRTPVIASLSGALPEVVGDAAILIDPHNEDEIAIAMDQIIEDSFLAEDLGRRGQLQAEQFNWDATARTIEDLLQEIY